MDMTGLRPAPDERGWAFVESLAKETEQMRQARQQSAEMNSAFVTPAEGAALRVLAHTNHAKHIVEIGTSAGGATQWLVQGIDDDGQVTSIDVDGEHHRVAKQLFGEAGIPAPKIRLILGKPLEVLPRLSDQSYDIVVVSSELADLNLLFDATVRLLRERGLFILLNALGNARVGDPAQRDPATVSRRLFVQRVNNDPQFTTSLLPVGDGILVASLKAHA